MRMVIFYLWKIFGCINESQTYLNLPGVAKCELVDHNRLPCHEISALASEFGSMDFNVTYVPWN